MVDRVPHAEILSVLSYHNLALRNPFSEGAIRQQSALGECGQVIYIQLLALVLEQEFIGVCVELEIVDLGVVADLTGNG